MSNFKRDTASQALEQIMLSEDATEWRPRGEGAEILLSDGEWLPVSAQRIAESASETTKLSPASVRNWTRCRAIYGQDAVALLQRLLGIKA